MDPQTTAIDFLWQRYQHIMPDLHLFKRYATTALPCAVHVNTLKTTREACQSALQEAGINSEPLPWHEHGLQINSTQHHVGHSWPYNIGLLQTQEAVSLIPATLLDPQPGERVLDMCAAPGGKSVQMAVMMQNKGSITANDLKSQRLRALGHMVKRLGITNIASTLYDGRSIPAPDGFFDKVLIDAPCSCEGMLRKGAYHGQAQAKHARQALANIQQELLTKAIQVTRPGGRIVYSTCTFAPEENEAVINAVLEHMQDDCELVPANLPGLNHSPGLTQWHDEKYDDSLRHCMRLWPQTNDTGGFFIAVIEKKAGRLNNNHDAKTWRDTTFPTVLLTALERFGFDQSILDQHQLHTNPNRGVFIFNRECAIPQAINTDSNGLFALKTNTLHPKITTPLAMMLAPQATRNVIELTAEQRDQYCQRQNITLTVQQQTCCEDSGYIMCHYSGLGLGLGLYLRHKQPDRLVSLFPKHL